MKGSGRTSIFATISTFTEGVRTDMFSIRRVVVIVAVSATAVATPFVFGKAFDSSGESGSVALASAFDLFEHERLDRPVTPAPTTTTTARESESDEDELSPEETYLLVLYLTAVEESKNAPPPTTTTARQAPPPTPAPPPAPVQTGPPTEAQWTALRACESDSSGGYQAISRSGTYRGAYQFDQATWDETARRYYPHLVGVDPATASPADQDAMALALWRYRRWQPWPVCGLKAAAAR